MLNELVISAIAYVIGFATCSILAAKKTVQTLIARKGEEVTVATRGGEKQFLLAADLLQSDEYAILTMKVNESMPPVTFAVKSDQVKK